MWAFVRLSNEIEDLVAEDLIAGSVFKGLQNVKTNPERVDFVYEILKNRPKFKDLISKPKIPKSDERSIKFRKEGNKVFMKKQFSQALQLYTQSIANAEINSPNLALAYANRSAVFFEKQYFKECLEDITRALENNYPAHLKEKLLNRQRRAEILKPIQIFVEYHDPVPSFKTANQNSLIKAASNCVRIKHNHKLGQHILAVRDIKVGEIIAIEKPYVSAIESDSQFLHCHECLEYCVNMIPCTSCTSVLYCGEVCRERAFNAYHKYKCNLMQVVTHPILSLQMVIKAFTETENQENIDPSNKYCSNSFREVKALQTNVNAASLANLYVHAVSASLCYFSLKNHTSFFSDLKVSSTTLKEYLMLCEMVTIHQTEIEKIKPKPIEIFNDLSSDKDKIRIGLGLYSFSSLFSHSCAPNVSYTHYGSVQVIRAICNIKQGEQCLSNYGISYSSVELLKRRYFLKENFQFLCRCKACVNLWPPLNFMMEGRGLPQDFLAKLKEQRVSENGVFDMEFGKQLLLDAINVMDMIEKYEPCKNFLRIQHFIIEMFIYMGNRIVNF